MNNSILNDIKGVFQSGNFLFQIIILNIAIFLILNILVALTPVEFSQSIIQVFGLSADVGSSYWMVWTYFTYMFTHLGFNHIFFNLLIFYYIGQILGDLYGQKQLLQTYLYGGVLGGALFVLLANLIPSISTHVPLIGASAGIMAVIVAIGYLQPNYNMRFFTFQIPLKYIVLAAFVLSSILDLNHNTGGKIAHFGGALYGFILARSIQNGTNLNSRITNWITPLLHIFKMKPKIKVVHKNNQTKKAAPTKESQAEVNKILDKISKSGYDSLSKTEKDYLFKFGKE